MLWAWLSQAWSGWRPALVLIKPDTVLAWHRRRFRLFWTWKRRSRTGRPAAAVGAYALLALMVAAVGLYGLLSHMVGTRQREIGIRLVLSAQIRSVRSLVVREGAVLAVAGVIVGLGAALAATRAAVDAALRRERARSVPSVSRLRRCSRLR